MFKLSLLAILLVALTGCKDRIPCQDDVLELSPRPVELGEGPRNYVYFSASEGAKIAGSPENIPYRSASAVMISRLQDSLPIGVVLVADVREGVPTHATPMMRDDAAARALDGLTGGWIADVVAENAAILAESDPESDRSVAAAREAETLAKLLGREPRTSRKDLEYARRKRWAEALRPRKLDVGIVDGKPLNDWVFRSEECPSDIPNARFHNVDSDDEAKAALKLLAEWSGVEPALPARWKGRAPL